MSRDPEAFYLPDRRLPMIGFLYARKVEQGAEIGLGHEPPYEDMRHNGVKISDFETMMLIDALIGMLPEDMASIYRRRKA